ncbi:alcohol dehydrogenase catalytic domain-containing protein [Nocardioides alcanivorans]|uniref:alcohol dehydrogenase catalytic domain-containing protein n=1 Tax=Nocardioides alcanivorans TaxID=2897352 RepID=UPI001F286108|nr:alcohol dehydrogenase catalytic domain-containing protein [Nocardioides alcanivorans]
MSGLRVPAAVLSEAPGALTVGVLDLDSELEPDEVRVRVVACGLCHSDLHMLEGDLPTSLPTVPGHELAGVVEEVGSAVGDLVVGDHVVACLSMFCGGCRECSAGRSWLCERRAEIGWPDRARPRLSRDGAPVGQVAGLGGLAGAAIVHHHALVRVPKELPFEQAALLGCAVMTGIGSAINGAGVRPGETVAVIGCGGVGLNIIQGARLAGAQRIVAVDRSAAGLELAATFGATDSVLVDDDHPVAAVRDLLPGGVDHAFDVVGISATVNQAVGMLRAGRTAYLIGVPAAGATLDLPGLHMLTQAKGLQGLLMGSNRFRQDIPMLAELALQGRIDLGSLVSTVLPSTGSMRGSTRCATPGPAAW